ncbi:helix-turn-helix transcriptional regulator [Pedobacter aquatilis]|uniref:helix-turn-helix domain-containing protein n=1 Tax=Pedobacter aquatilis TaxID=351343 RepID=UPI00292D0BA5|nr:helix-turn-helix transcriptional regulator [Pedobacter aquatilis]
MLVNESKPEKSTIKPKHIGKTEGTSGVNIGLLIWKEMKRQGISQTELAEKLGIKKGKMSNIINSTDLRTDQLYDISKILNHDFFAYYHPVNGKIKSATGESNASIEKIALLNSLLQEKTVMLGLSDKTIQSQKEIIKNLELLLGKK